MLAPVGSPQFSTRNPIPAGANALSYNLVLSIDIQRYKRDENFTYCNKAFAAYAAARGHPEFKGKLANQIYEHFTKPGSGWQRVSAAEAIVLAQQGEFVAGAHLNQLSAKRWGPARAIRPDGRAPGHVAIVLGEYSPGVPGIAQAGDQTFEWGPVTRSDVPLDYFVFRGAAS